VTKDGRIKILDFGLAKLDPAKAASSDGSTISLQQETNPGHVLGTVGYMSPEQVRGQAADARSDIFAVGVILYEMLTGKPAFRKATSAETMTAILNDDPAAVSQLAPSVPPGLQRVVNRRLAKNPAQRIQHASDLEFALESLSDSSGSGVTGVHEAASSKTWIWLAAGTAIAIAIAAALTLWWRQPPAVPLVEAVNPAHG
jgi:eukaryotic-like serine/threonine-protein kinase